MDFKFLGLVALVLVIVTGGAALPLLPFAMLLGLAGLLFEWAVELYEEFQRNRPK
jgi:hypothetical protein